MLPDGWSIKRLDELGRSMGGLTYSPDDVIDSGGTLVLRSSNILHGEIVYGNDVFVRGPVSENVRVKQGDILVCARNGSRSLIGKSALVDAESAGHAFGAFMAVYRSPDYAYIFQLFQTSNFKRQVDRHLGATINQVTAKSLASFRFPIPPQQERSALVGILTCWDRQVIALRRLIKFKRRLKRGLMQQLLTGSRRFPEFAGQPLQKMRLGDVLEKVAVPITPASGEMYRQIGVRSHGKGIFHKSAVTGESLGNKRVFRVVPGCLTLNIIFAWERALAITSEGEAGMIASHRFPMFRPDRLRFMAEYALLYLLSERGLHQIRLASPGGAGRNRTLNQEAFLKTPISLPSLPEQQKIAAMLAAADREIELLEQQLAAFREQKKGLMQKLLTGRIRVNSK